MQTGIMTKRFGWQRGQAMLMSDSMTSSSGCHFGCTRSRSNCRSARMLSQYTSPIGLCILPRLLLHLFSGHILQTLLAFSTVALTNCMHCILCAAFNGSKMAFCIHWSVHGNERRLFHVLFMKRAAGNRQKPSVFLCDSHGNILRKRNSLKRMPEEKWENNWRRASGSAN